MWSSVAKFFKNLFGGGSPAKPQPAPAPVAPAPAPVVVAPAAPAPVASVPPKQSPGKALFGVDLSHYQTVSNWATLSKNISFVFLKATQSTDYVDPTFKANWAKAKANGVPRGAYHVIDCKVDTTAQAEYYMKTVGALESGDLNPVLDFEGSVNQSETMAENKAACLAYLAEIAKLTGRRPILYASKSSIEEMSFNAVEASAFDLWVAAYGSKYKTAPIPAPWKACVMWQWTDAATVAGVSVCDGDYMYVDISELTANS